MSGPSTTVARGTIRVDARMAVERLRSHQLIDLHLHALEALRFAAASDATRIDVGWSRESLWLEWDGAPLEPRTLERLLDHLLSESEDPSLRRPRWLAFAVNAALGLETEWVEVTSRGASGSVTARWTPDDGNDGIVPSIQAEEVKGAAGPWCMRMEVRRRTGWLSRLFGSDSPPREVEAMWDTTCLLGDRLRVQGAPFPRSPRLPALVRMPFALPGASRAHVELTAAGNASPIVEWCEQGVRLAACRWTPLPAFPSAPHAGCELPVRVVVEASELDTNASRSALRSDSPMMRQLPALSHEAFSDAVHALACRVISADGASPEAVFLTDDDAALEDSLGAVLCVIAGAYKNDPSQSKLVPWLDMPVLRNGVGHPTPLTPWLDPKRVLVAWRGEQPLPEELAPWLGDVLWLRGRTAERVLRDSRVTDARDVVRKARASLARRTRFLATPPSDRLIAPAADCLASSSSQFTQDSWEGLKLEVALRPPSDAHPFVVRVFVDGRFIESLPQPPAAFPLHAEVGVEWPQRLQPLPDYDGVRNDLWLRKSLWVGVVESLRLANRLAPELSSAAEPRAALLRSVLRTAIQTHAGFTLSLELQTHVEHPALDTFASLIDAPVWPTASGGFRSTRSVIADAERTGMVQIAAQLDRSLPADTTVLTVREQHLAWLRYASVRDIAIVPFDPRSAGAESPSAITSPAATPQQPSSDYAPGERVAPTALMGNPDESTRVFLSVASDSGAPEATVAAALTDRAPAHVRVLFREHKLLELVWRDWDLPISLTVGLWEPDCLRSADELSVRGLEALNDLAIRGGLALAARLIERCRDRDGPSGLLRDATSLAVVAGSLRSPSAAHAELELGVMAALRASSWPTIQGDEQPVERLRAGDAGLLVGRIRFEPWHGPTGVASEFDAPIAWIPSSVEAAHAEAILKSLHGALQDVTGVVSLLQARRASGAKGDPTLAGAPAHPRLRASLQTLGVRCAAGELELADGAPEVLVEGLEGEPVRIDAKMPIPVRAIARVDELLTTSAKKKLLTELTRAASRLLKSSLSAAPELPAFARAAMRRFVCIAVSKSRKIDPRGLEAPVFQDIAGGWHSYRELQASKRPLWHTTDPPPYPEHDQPQRVLCLCAEEAAAVGKELDVRDLTQRLRRELAGEQRRRQPPFDTIALSPAVRAQCLQVIRIDTPDFAGELGLLDPHYGKFRGLDLLVGKRPLCKLPDGPGWPLAGVIDCAGLEPNRWFDGPRKRRQADTLIAALRAEADRASREWLKSKSAGLAHRVVQLSKEADSSLGAMHLLGVFWLPEHWPEAPQALLRSSLPSRSSESATLCIPPPIPSVHGVVPVCAELYAFHEICEQDSSGAARAWRELAVTGSQALNALQEMLLECSDKLDKADTDAWQCDLALLGIPSARIEARCLDGSVIDTAALLELLNSNRRIALSTGVTPAALRAQGPVLLDEDSAVCRVLRARAPGHLLDLSARPVPRSGPIWGDESSTWFERLIDALPGGECTARDGLDARIAEGLRGALAGLRLSGDPVKEVRGVRRGRPIRFRASDGVLLLRADHPSIRACCSLPTDSALVLLTGAALAEINRALVSVTDSEERRGLEAMMRTASSRGSRKPHT